MKRTLDDMVIKFKKGDLSKRFILRFLSKFILQTPSRCRHYGRDLCYDFYAYIAGKLDELVQAYEKREHSGFQAWFLVVLRREFFYYLQHSQKNDDLDLAPDIYYNLYHKDTIGCQKEILSVVKTDLITQKERKVIALKYGIPLEDQKVEAAVKIILNKLERRKKIERILIKRYRWMIKIQKQMATVLDPDKLAMLKEKERKHKAYKRRLERIFLNYRILPSNEWVAKQLGLTENTVGVYLFRIRKKLMKVL